MSDDRTQLLCYSKCKIPVCIHACYNKPVHKQYAVACTHTQSNSKNIDKPALTTKDTTHYMCCTTDDDWEEVEHKSDEEEDDVMAAVAAITKRDAQLQEQLPKAASNAAHPAAPEEALGPSWSDLEVLLLFIILPVSNASQQAACQCLQQQF